MVRRLAVGLLVFVALVGGPRLTAADPIRSNIVFILADDLGWTDIGAFGSRYYETPNIDRLAAQGMKLTRYHTSPNCQPTRAALLSGQYGPRTGVYTVGSIERFHWRSRSLRPVENVTALPLDKITFAQTLQKAGYATAMFGKWHLGDTGPHHPSKRGFDEAIVTAGAHYDFKTTPAVDLPKGAYLADWLTDRAVDFVRRHQSRPFFLYLPHFAVHTPHQAKPELVARFRPKPAVGGHKDPTYAAMIASLDDSVGRVLATLDELKLTDNTLVVFATDNGGVGGYVREGIKASDATDNAPLRSGKGSLYEGGTRTPFIARWPGQVKPGTSCDVPVIHVDVYPTLLDAAGVPPPSGYTLDGETLLPLLRGTATGLQRDAIYQHFPGYLGASGDKWRTTPAGTVTVGDWKLMEFFEEGRLELYNLRDDVGETNNLARAMPDKANELHVKLKAWRAAVKAPMPTPNTEKGNAPPAKKKKKQNDSTPADGE